jgi:xanthine dehydrogenase iron-sulfur cluster and FAD-binding subunit A
VMSVVGLLAQHPNPTAEQIDEGLSGNLCRCTGYASIRRAVIRAAELSPAPSPAIAGAISKPQPGRASAPGGGEGRTEK